MKKYCGKCGSKLNIETGICPNCDKELLINKFDKVMEQKEKSKNGVKTKALIVLMILCSVIGSVAYLSKDEREDSSAKVKENEKANTLYEEAVATEFANDETKEKYIYKQSVWKYMNQEGKLDWWEYKYDSEGNMTKRIKYDETGKVITTTNWEYDDGGKRLKEINYDENGKAVTTKEYEYNDEGNVLKEIDYDGNREEISVREYEYNDEGKLIEATIYTGEKVTNLCEYDENERIIKQIGYDEDGNISYEHNNDYDVKGRLIKEKQAYYNGTYEYMQSDSYEYDEDGNCKKRIEYDEDGDIWGCEVYVYDEYNRKIKTTYYNGNEVSIWKWDEYTYQTIDKNTQKTIMYEYDSQGKEIAREETEVTSEELKSHSETIRYKADGSTSSWWNETEYIKIKVK